MIDLLDELEKSEVTAQDRNANETEFHVVNC